MYHSVTSLLLLILPLAVATPAPRSLLRRATFDPNAVPAQCTSACNPLTATVVACDATSNTVACGLCTTKTEQEALQCANCIVALNPTTDVVSEGQLDIDEYIDECSALGVVLPPVKVTVPKTASTSNANAGAPSPSQGASNPPSGGNVNPLGGGGSGLVNGASSLHVRPLPKVLVGISVIGHLLIRAGMYM